MASRPMKEAIGLNALSEFAKAFVAAKQQKQAQAMDEERFARTLAAKRLEEEQARRYQQFQAELATQKAIQGVTEAGAKKSLYDTAGRLTGYEQRGIDPATVAAGQAELEAIRQRFLGVSYAPSIMPGVPSAVPTTDRPGAVSAFPGLDVQPAEARLEVNPTALPEFQTRPITGLRPAESVKQTGAANINGSGAEKDSTFWKNMDAEFAETAQEWETTGRVQSASGIAALGQTANDFMSGKVKGGWLGLIPGRALTRPELDQAVKQVEKVVFPQLRATMGAQFTEKEGKRVIDATIDPTQTGENNARRILALSEAMKKQAADKERMLNYAKKTGTLRGYPAPKKTGTELANELISRVNEQVGAPAGATDNETPEQRKARLLEELKGAF